MQKYAREKGVFFARGKLLTGNREEIYDLGQNAHFVEEDEGVKQYIGLNFMRSGGMFTTKIRSGQQWDAQMAGHFCSGLRTKGFGIITSTRWQMTCWISGLD